jgi:hypothetical protein
LDSLEIRNFFDVCLTIFKNKRILLTKLATDFYKQPSCLLGERASFFQFFQPAPSKSNRAQLPLLRRCRCRYRRRHHPHRHHRPGTNVIKLFTFVIYKSS